MAVDNFLWRAGWALLLAAVACLILTFTDARQVNHVNTWIKPLKFALSIGTYLLTAALLLPLSPWSAESQEKLSLAIIATIGAAYLIILIQAARAVPSHFNVTTPLDGALFGTMGLCITAHTVAQVVMLWSFNRAELPSALLWGIRLGLVSIILGGLQGFTMTSRLAHTVGAPDGGPGLPFLNWSTIAGDLRIAHAAAIHGFQILPLAGWLLSRAQVPRGALLVWILFAAQAAFSFVTHLQALSGKPLIAAAASTSPQEQA